MKFNLVKLLIIINIFMLPACSNLKNSLNADSNVFTATSANKNLIHLTNQAGDSLSKLPPELIGKNMPVVIMTSFVNANNFLYSSTLGLTASEMIAGRLVQNGFPVKEIRLRGDILVKGNHGEMLLSRDFKQVAKQQSADAVVVGTYAEAANTVLISTKMIRLSDEHVISAHNFSVDKTEDIATLLHGVRQKDKYPLIEGEEDADNNLNTGAINGTDTLMDAVREYDIKTNKRRMNQKLENL